jgi:O-succinylbenzoic acid--CoA ligase
MSSLPFDLYKSWLSQDSHLLLNPRLDAIENEMQNRLFKKFSPDLQAHVWLNSSGSSKSENESLKLIALSKKAILASAASVNQHLQVTKRDSWLCALPVFHVGGLGIYARAFLSATSVSTLQEWSPHSFLQVILSDQITLSSLVPTQVYDLVSAGLRAPSSLRAVVVGGAALDEKLFLEARQLGWPLLISYGMTETASQIATASLHSLNELGMPDSVAVLSHAQISVSAEGYLEVHGSSLMTGSAQIKNGVEHWQPSGAKFLTSDRGELKDGKLKFLGRDSEFIKILGEGVNLQSLESRLRELYQHRNLVVLAKPDPRRGFQLFALVESMASAESLNSSDLQQWNQRCLPFERLEKIVLVPKFPRSVLGKVNKVELLAQLSSGLV